MIPMKLNAYFLQFSARRMRRHHSTVKTSQTPTPAQRKSLAKSASPGRVSAPWSSRSTPMMARIARSIPSENGAGCFMVGLPGLG